MTTTTTNRLDPARFPAASGMPHVASTAEVVRVDPARDPRWDALAARHPLAGPAHLSGWSAMLAQAFPRLRGIYLALPGGDGSRLDAALPLYHARSLLTGNRLVCLPFATFADPLVDDAGQLRRLLAAAREEAGRLDAAYVEIRATGSAELARECGMQPARRFKVHALRLDREPEALLKKFDRSCVRQQVAKSLKSGLRAEPARTDGDLRAFYRLYLLTRKRLQLPPLPPEFFEGLFAALAPTGNLEILLARKDHAVAGGLLMLRLGKRTSFESVGVDPAFQELSPFHFLYWHGILRAHELGGAEIDFGRTAETNTGLMNFKRRWNTEVSDLVHCILPTQAAGNGRATPPLAALGENSLRYRALRLACKLAPEDAMVRIGRFCYRHNV